MTSRFLPHHTKETFMSSEGLWSPLAPVEVTQISTQVIPDILTRV